jgi:hypothetical protein
MWQGRGRRNGIERGGEEGRDVAWRKGCGMEEGGGMERGGIERGGEEGCGMEGGGKGCAVEDGGRMEGQRVKCTPKTPQNQSRA